MTSGLVLLIVGCIASIYSAYTNLRFINNPIDFIYYFRYLILLGSGFAAGYLFTTRITKSQFQDKLFSGVIYSLLAIGLFELLDIVRLVFQNMFGFPPFPLGKVVFEGLPLFSAVVILIVAYFTRRKLERPGLSALVKVVLIFLFIIYQGYILTDGVYYLIAGAGAYGPNIPVLSMVGSYLTIPIVIAIVSYLFLNNMKKWFDRLFYAVLIATFYHVFTIVLWEFRTDPSYDATNIFDITVKVITLLCAGILLWRARKAIK